jgi:hypothetical protein
MMHEAALAVRAVSPEKFHPFCKLLFARQTEYFDKNTYDKSRSQIYSELVALAATLDVPSKEMAEKLLLKPSSDGNGGNAVTDALKYEIKLSRHVIDCVNA